MADKNPYDDLIMDHIKNARNYFVLGDVNRKATGSNPLCGDDFTVYLKVVSDKIEEISFQCTCCGISMASASIMMEVIKGRNAHDASTQLQTFISTLRDLTVSSLDIVTREQLALLETVKKFPSRNDCATLPWQILKKALDQDPLSDR